ncbi:MAG: CDP-alcohol phosphatidyltransferase family protein, partial [Bacillota bacterium]|nr:CDP-alcohol phosphatidyltransferase family protein [Bacillota bacterium]
MLTVLRLVLSICFLVLLGLYRTVISESGYAALFAVIGLTDFFDGKLARKWKVQSGFGAVMDVFCD